MRPGYRVTLVQGAEGGGQSPVRSLRRAQERQPVLCARLWFCFGWWILACLGLRFTYKIKT